MDNNNYCIDKFVEKNRDAIASVGDPWQKLAESLRVVGRADLSEKIISSHEHFCGARGPTTPAARSVANASQHYQKPHPPPSQPREISSPGRHNITGRSDIRAADPFDALAQRVGRLKAFVASSEALHASRESARAIWEKDALANLVPRVLDTCEKYSAQDGELAVKETPRVAADDPLSPAHAYALKEFLQRSRERIETYAPAESGVPVVGDAHPALCSDNDADSIPSSVSQPKVTGTPPCSTDLDADFDPVSGIMSPFSTLLGSVLAAAEADSSEQEPERCEFKPPSNVNVTASVDVSVENPCAAEKEPYSILSDILPYENAGSPASHLFRQSHSPSRPHAMHRHELGPPHPLPPASLPKRGAAVGSRCDPPGTATGPSKQDFDAIAQRALQLVTQGPTGIGAYSEHVDLSACFRTEPRGADSAHLDDNGGDEMPDEKEIKIAELLAAEENEPSASRLQPRRVDQDVALQSSEKRRKSFSATPSSARASSTPTSQRFPEEQHTACGQSPKFLLRHGVHTPRLHTETPKRLVSGVPRYAQPLHCKSKPTSDGDSSGRHQSPRSPSLGRTGRSGSSPARRAFTNSQRAQIRNLEALEIVARDRLSRIAAHSLCDVFFSVFSGVVPALVPLEEQHRAQRAVATISATPIATAARLEAAAMLPGKRRSTSLLRQAGEVSRWPTCIAAAARRCGIEHFCGNSVGGAVATSTVSDERARSKRTPTRSEYCEVADLMKKAKTELVNPWDQHQPHDPYAGLPAAVKRRNLLRDAAARDRARCAAQRGYKKAAECAERRSQNIQSRVLSRLDKYDESLQGKSHAISSAPVGSSTPSRSSVMDKTAASESVLCSQSLSQCSRDICYSNRSASATRGTAKPRVAIRHAFVSPSPSPPVYLLSEGINNGDIRRALASPQGSLIRTPKRPSHAAGAADTSHSRSKAVHPPVRSPGASKADSATSSPEIEMATTTCSLSTSNLSGISRTHVEKLPVSSPSGSVVSPSRTAAVTLCSPTTAELPAAAVNGALPPDTLANSPLVATPASAECSVGCLWLGSIGSPPKFTIASPTRTPRTAASTLRSGKVLPSPLPIVDTVSPPRPPTLTGERLFSPVRRTRSMSPRSVRLPAVEILAAAEGDSPVPLDHDKVNSTDSFVSATVRQAQKAFQTESAMLFSLWAASGVAGADRAAFAFRDPLLNVPPLPTERRGNDHRPFVCRRRASVGPLGGGGSMSWARQVDCDGSRTCGATEPEEAAIADELEMPHPGAISRREQWDAVVEAGSREELQTDILSQALDNALARADESAVVTEDDERVCSADLAAAESLAASRERGHLLDAIVYAEALRNEQLTIQLLFRTADACSRAHDHAGAILHLTRAVRVAKRLRLAPSVATGCSALAAVFEKLGCADQVAAWQNRAKAAFSHTG